MPLAAEVDFQVPVLADDDIWFANAAAWTNYWADVPASISIDPAATAAYVPTAFDNTLPVYDFVFDGNHKNIPSIEIFTSLVNQVAALDANFQNLKTALKNAGLISTI